MYSRRTACDAGLSVDFLPILSPTCVRHLKAAWLRGFTAFCPLGVASPDAWSANTKKSNRHLSVLPVDFPVEPAASGVDESQQLMSAKVGVFLHDGNIVPRRF